MITTGSPAQIDITGAVFSQNFVAITRATLAP